MNNWIIFNRGQEEIMENMGKILDLVPGFMIVPMIGFIMEKLKGDWKNAGAIWEL